MTLEILREENKAKLYDLDHLFVFLKNGGKEYFYFRNVY